MDREETETRDTERRRTILIASVVVIAFVGFFIGVRQEQHRVPYSAAGSASDQTGAPPARSHAELAVNPWRPAEKPWTPVMPEGAPVTNENREAYEQALADRAARRAYAGAPPTIPHPVSQASALECQVCHDRGGLIAGRLAPPMSHESYTVCTQCHAPEVPGIAMSDEPSAAATAESSFAGLREPPAPLQWAAISPPQIPHRTFMRERCDSCHGPAGRPGLQTDHPERQVCQQCHAASAVVDQRPLPPVPTR